MNDAVISTRGRAPYTADVDLGGGTHTLTYEYYEHGATRNSRRMSRRFRTTP
jgi:hypothetical protein